MNYIYLATRGVLGELRFGRNKASAFLNGEPTVLISEMLSVPCEISRDLGDKKERNNYRNLKRTGDSRAFYYSAGLRCRAGEAERERKRENDKERGRDGRGRKGRLFSRENFSLFLLQFCPR